MQNYYIPCTQQDRLKGNSKRSDPCQSFFRRPSSVALEHQADIVPQHSSEYQWNVSQSVSQSQTPSLGNTSSPSQEDELSPRTPSSSTSDDLCAISQDRIKKENVSVSGGHASQGDGCQYTSARPLATRTSISGKHDQRPVYSTSGKQSRSEQRPLVPPVIQETAVRSRLARVSAPQDINPASLPARVNVKQPSAVVTFNSRCHARRRPCAPSTTAAPPKLKRDTECTDAIVRLIVCFSTKLVHTMWSESTSTPKSSTAFHGAGVLPLRVFIQETLRRSKTSYSTLQVALFYLILLKPFVGAHHKGQDVRGGGCRALQCGRRMFLTALILASKYLQDRNYSSRAWSKISGLPINEINENERRYLNLIQFDLHMKKETFENWSKIVLTLCKMGETGMGQELASGASNTASLAGDDETKSGSDYWWSRQLARLSADLIRDTEQTEAYLASLKASKAESDIVPEQLMASLDTPPSSPDSIGDLLTEPNLAKNSSELDSQFQQKTIDTMSSPASVASLPSRPNLPNLPTPQTTPRFARTLPPPRNSCQTGPRCRDSSRLLLGLDKHAMAVANLETCPPPQPKMRDQARYGYGPRREASSLCNNVSAAACVSSPESMISDVSSIAPRSRSSSISSTSSAWWPSSGQQWSDDGTSRACPLRKDMPRPAFARSSSSTETVMPSSYGFYHGSLTTPTAADLDTTSQANFAIADGDGNSSEREMANILASLTNCRTSSADEYPAVVSERSEQGSNEVHDQPYARKHKRERSSMSEDVLQGHVRQYVWDGSSPIEVIESTSVFADFQHDKQLQYPAKQWACPKKPIANGMHTKRFALHHDGSTCSTNVASRFLRENVAMVN